VQEIPAHELVLARSIVSFTLSYYIIRKRKLPLFGNNKKWLFIRGISGMIALTLFFMTIAHLPLAIASTVQYLAPIFTVILSVIILGEKVLKTQWLFILIALSGVILIGFNNLLLTDQSFAFDYFWFGIGMVSAVFSGLAYAAIKKSKGTDEPINIVIYFPMLALPVMTIWCLFEFVMPVGIEWLYLLIIGIFTQIAQVLMTKAFHEGDASTIAPFQYLGAIYAFFVGYFIFQEQLSEYVEFGIMLIIFGLILNTLSQKFKRKRKLEG
jgi:drug/metabolite transporter (DMT)-like permease